MEQLPSLVEYGFRRVFISLIAVICTLLSVMGISAANVAFPDIRVNLGMSFNEIPWIVTAYSLAYIIIMPFSSWLSRQFGRRNYFATAVILFTVCSFFCGNAISSRELIIFRFLQGLGGGGMLVLSHTIITESWPVEKRPASQAVFILGMLAGEALVRPFGGYITDNYSWPYVFFANIPVGVIACVLILTCVRNGSYEKREDWPGTMTLTIGASSLYLLARGQYENWLNTPFIIVLSLAGLTGIILFVGRQLRFIAPSGETGLLRNVSLRTGLILSFITAFGVAGSSTTPVSLSGWGLQLPVIPVWSPILGLILMLAVAAVLIEKGNALKYIITTGMLFFAIYSYMLYRTESGDMSAGYIVWLLIIRSLAVALLSVSVSTLALSKLKGKQIGQGVALYHITLQLGIVLGLALFSLRADMPAELKRIELLSQLDVDDPEVVQHVIDAGAAMDRDTSMINYKVNAFMQANAAKEAAVHSRYIFVLILGIIFLVCIPFVLYLVKNRAVKNND